MDPKHSFIKGLHCVNTATSIISTIWVILISYHINGVARMVEKLYTSKGDYCIKQLFSKIVILFKMGTSLKGKNLLPEGRILSFMSSS